MVRTSKAADLRGATITGDLRFANFAAAELTGACLFWANLTGAFLNQANFTGAQLFEAVFADNDLGSVVGLDKCEHFGASMLDYRTLTKSGPLPLVFLRGCGLPDTLIQYLPSLLNQPIQFNSCFISHSSKDRDFAERLHADLQDKGVRCWFAPHDVAAGKKLHEQIDEAIRVHDRLLLILSERSMNSERVKTEIAKARAREVREKRQMLFPVSLVSFAALRDWECFDADTGKDSAREIREYFIPDFSCWKDHDQYQRAFDRLLKDLTDPSAPRRIAGPPTV
jgi:TIR domain/Pentapeptide repeats (8 copies)